MTRWSGFKINDLKLALELDVVKEIIQIPRLTRLPNTLPFILGVFAVRGNFLGLFDLGVILGIGGTELNENSKCLILSNGQLSFGIPVTEVLTIFPVTEEKIDSDLMSLLPGIRRFVIGKYLHRSDTIYLLDSKKMFLSEEITLYL